MVQDWFGIGSELVQNWLRLESIDFVGNEIPKKNHKFTKIQFQKGTGHFFAQPRGHETFQTGTNIFWVHPFFNDKGHYWILGMVKKDQKGSNLQKWISLNEMRIEISK